jgi:DNA-binding transcriptional ArsR family regulator
MAIARRHFKFCRNEPEFYQAIMSLLSISYQLLAKFSLPKLFPNNIFNLLVDNKWLMIILNYMVEYRDDKILSETLKAISDTTRRSLLTQLCQQGPSRVTDLAAYYDMSLNAISKHIKVLEMAGLVTRKNMGRTHWIEANIKKIGLVEDWFKELKSIWELRLEKLDKIMKNGGIENG